jgi:predicted transcriptional regulator
MGVANVATPEHFVDHNGLSREQIDLIQRFEADFNAVEHSLCVALGIEQYERFTHLVRKYAKSHGGWGDAELLIRIAKIRNLIVHDKTEPFRYGIVPAPATAEELRKCKERLINPARALPTFQRMVEIISIHDTLTRVLKIIDQRDYSQFPVYEDKRFRGLLTENGVTRWLARHVAKTISLVELDDIPVSQVLQSEEERKNHQFVPHDMRVDDVSTLFAKQALLEAVLVTSSGKETEELLGIATRWDILQLA